MVTCSGCPTLVQHDPVPGGQQLQGTDPRDDIHVEPDVLGQGVDQPQGRVVERRVAPHQQPDVAGPFRQHLLVRRHPGQVPVAHGSRVVGRVVAVPGGSGTMTSGGSPSSRQTAARTASSGSSSPLPNAST